MAQYKNTFLSMIVILILLKQVNSKDDLESTASILKDPPECVTNFTSSSKCFIRNATTIILTCPKILLCRNLTINYSSITIIGNGSTLYCKNNSSLQFHCNPVIDIRDVSIQNCGSLFTSNTSVDVIYNTIVKFTSAVYIYNSSKVFIDNVTIRYSNGIGLSLISINEEVHIMDSQFENNSRDESTSAPGGGGVYIEHITQKSQDNNKILYQISHCNFTGNNASSGYYPLTHFPLHNDEKQGHFLFGRGGGLSVNLGLHTSSSVHITVENCKFEENIANRGGGLFVFFLPNSSNSLIELSNNSFTSNKCTKQNLPPNIYSAGGGMALLYLTNSRNNSCIIKHCNFIKNEAYYGGAVSMGTEMDTRSLMSSFLIEHSQFEENSARIGSALDLFCYSTPDIISQCIITPEVKDVNVTSNGGNYTYNNSSSKSKTFSTVHIDSVQATFSGKVTIKGNNASGIGIENGHLKLNSTSYVKIQGNLARLGGGISILGSSGVYLQSNTSLLIIGNMATDRGGGIYVDLISETFSIYSYTCFIKYSGANMSTHPDHWLVDVTFSNNTANGRNNAIFASSIYPCVWPQNETSNPEKDVNATFCGWNINKWKFDNNCRDLIETLPRKFSKNMYKVALYPNVRKKIDDFKVIDDLNQDVTNYTHFTTCILSVNNKLLMPNMIEPDISISNEGILMNRLRNPGEYKVLVQTAYHRTVSTIVVITILECPVGFKSNGTSQCTCYVERPLICNSSSMTLNLLIGKCMGYDTLKNKTDVFYAKCPFTITRLFENPYTSISSTGDEFNNNYCKRYNRRGFLCNSCFENYSINIFDPSYQCIHCKYSYMKWIKAIATIIGPQTLFFLVVIIFHVGITSPSMNGYIFFSHVITLPIEVLLIKSGWELDELRNHADLLTNLLLGPYRIWSFDYPEIFHVKECLHESIHVMHAIAIRYIHALYPITLVVVTLLFIELHARNCKPVVYMWKPLCLLCIRFRRNWEVKTSVIDAFATVILLSYSKIITTSLYLLPPNYVFNSKGNVVEKRLDYDTSVLYFKQQHIIFGSIAITILCTFGAIPPFLLLFYPTKWFHKMLTCIKLDRWHGLHVFVETLNGSYKNGTNGSPERRWFAGVYFIFRIIIVSILTFTNDIVLSYFRLSITYTIFLLIIAIFRPYKKTFYIYLDITFMAILVITNTSVVYLITQVQNTNKLPKFTWRSTYSLLFVPTIYLIVYVFYLICTRSRSSFIQRHCVSNARWLSHRTFTFFENTRRTDGIFHDDTFSIISEQQPTQTYLDNFIEAPDRVDNPQRYYNLERSNHMEGASYSMRKDDSERKKLLGNNSKR